MNYQEQALKLLADGFAKELQSFIESDERFIELMMELTDKFIDENIPVRGEQNRTDLAFLMFDRVSMTTYIP